MKFIKDYFKYILIALLFLVPLLTYLLLKPYMISIISSFVIAYFFYPIYKLLNKIIKNKSLASFTLILLIIIVIIVPAFFIINKIIDQSVGVFHAVRNINLDQALKFLPFAENLNINYYVNDIINKILTIFLLQFSELAFTIPKRILKLFIMIFLLYYLFKDGKTLVMKIEEAIPMKKEDKEKMFLHLRNVMDATLYGIVLTAIIQGLIGMLGLFIFKVESPIFFGLLMIATSMIPFLGSAMIWLPLALYKLAMNDYFNGFGLLLYGAIIISLVDNIVRPMIIGKKARIHPAITLLGIIGGLNLFGFVGLILGPVLLVIFLTLFEVFLTEMSSLR